MGLVLCGTCIWWDLDGTCVVWELDLGGLGWDLCCVGVGLGWDLRFLDHLSVDLHLVGLGLGILGGLGLGWT
jgi:hypothetical protein